MQTEGMRDSTATTTADAMADMNRLLQSEGVSEMAVCFVTAGGFLLCSEQVSWKDGISIMNSRCVKNLFALTLCTSRLTVM